MAVNLETTMVNFRLRFVAAAAFAWLGFCSPLALVAQTPASAIEAPADAADGGTVLTAEQVEAGLAALEADSEVKEEVKALLRPKYQDAIDSLKKAGANQTRQENYRDAVKTGPAQTDELQARLAALPETGTLAGISPTGDAKDLQQETDRQLAVLAAQKEDLRKAVGELTRIKSRPVEISSSLPGAHRDLSDLRARMDSPEFADETISPEKIADRLLLQARELELQSILEMLKQEQLSQSAREGLLQARIELLALEVENTETAVDSLRTLLRKSLAREVKQVASQAETMHGEIGNGDARDLVEEVRALAKEFESVVEKLNKTIKKRSSINDRLDRLVNSSNTIKEQLKMSSGGVAMAQVLFNLERRLPNRYALRMDLRDHKAALDTAYLTMIGIDEHLGGQAKLEQRFDGRDSDAAVRVVSARREVLEKISTQYGRLIRELAGLVGEEQRYLDEINEARSFLSKELFWMRSSPPLGFDTLAEVPVGLKWLFNAAHRAEFGRAIVSAFRRQPAGSTVIVLAALLILFRRRAILAVIERTGSETRQIATNRFGLTIKAMLCSVTLALPVPILLGFAGAALSQSPKPSSWLQGLTHGLWIVTWIAFVLAFVAIICHKKGLGTKHFRWPEEPLIRLRRAIMWFAVIYLPSVLLVNSCLYGNASRFFNSTGRIFFMLGLFSTAMIYWKFLSFSAPVASGKNGKSQTTGIGRWQHVFFVLAVIGPLSLALLSWLGFLFTALELHQILIATMGVAVAGALLYWMMLSWFMIRVRRLALADALKRRRERQETAASQKKQGEPDDDNYGVAEAEKLDLAALGEQTKHLLRLVCITGTLIAVGLLWSKIFPVFVIIDSVTVLGTLTLFDLAQAVLIIVIATVATMNIPGLIRLVVLRTTDMDSGTLTAMTSICQYLLAAIGFTWVFEVLDLGWAQFGWIATALSVGLGFGLQEVVANFVCGLVLLFERPIRVGDYVTVEGMTGRVTKIRMRATTIVNWDRQEFVVPNKNFITGTLLNWTLQDSTTRIVVTVGVAYGSDTDKAQDILLGVAKAHPLVLDEPQPMATFEEFADSSLTLRLKVHIPNVYKRIQTLSDLHSAIKKRFETEGIEIAFPQRDLHIRTPGKLESIGQ